MQRFLTVCENKYHANINYYYVHLIRTLSVSSSPAASKRSNLNLSYSEGDASVIYGRTGKPINSYHKKVNAESVRLVKENPKLLKGKRTDLVKVCTFICISESGDIKNVSSWGPCLDNFLLTFL